MNAYDTFVLEKNAFLLLGRKSYICVCVCVCVCMYISYTYITRSPCSQYIKQILTDLKREINNYTE